MNWLPPHKCGLFLTHNEHKNYYETVAIRIQDGCIADRGWVSEEEKQRAIDTDELWELQWYPDTPNGSYTLVASSLDAIRSALKTMTRGGGNDGR